LPRKLDDDAQFRIILAGRFTQPQLDRIRQQHLVRKSVCADLLNFYKENNLFYRNVEIDRNNISKMPIMNEPEDMFDKLNDLDISSEVIDFIDIQQQRLNHRSTENANSNICEIMVVEKTVVFIDTEVNKTILATKALQEPIFTVHSPNSFANENEIAQKFPDLFPYGRGHPNENKRRLKLSQFQCAKHYLLQSLRKFSQDRYYTILAFDRLSMQNAYTRVALRQNKIKKFTKISPQLN